MEDENLALLGLRSARDYMVSARDVFKRGSRELSVAITECESAILWLQHDVATKVSCAPPVQVRAP